MPVIITLSGLSYRSPDGRALFDDLTLAFGRERTGLVGRNGAGKTSLTRIMLGELAPAEGTVSVTGTIGVLRQNPIPAADATVGDVLGVSEPLARLARIEAGEASDADLAEADWLLPSRLAAALADFGLPGLDLARPAAALSGGEATRAALAGLLAGEPDLLLLDEPTNHLDAASRQYVIEALTAWRGGAIVISHDRAVLRAMDRIVELSELGVRIYGGGYDLYAERKADERATAARRLDEAERGLRATDAAVQTARERKTKKDAAGKRSRLKADAPKMLLDARAERAEGTGARLGAVAERQRTEAAEALSEAQGAVERIRRLAFDLPPTGLAAGKTVLGLEAVTFAWPGGPPVLQGVDLRLTGPTRIAVTGPNGSGKTTLLRLAAGELQPSAGVIRRPAPSARLDQHGELLRDDETLVEAFLRLHPGATANAARAALARFLFRNTAAEKLCGALSGGERLRGALACVLSAVHAPQLLILDEPTSHLDLDSIEAVESALAGYDGALLVVSHDEDFLAAIGVQGTLAL
jgi:ATPase subunit of ABC transporter with duplicated ATPase domains